MQTIIIFLYYLYLFFLRRNIWDSILSVVLNLRVIRDPFKNNTLVIWSYIIEAFGRILTLHSQALCLILGILSLKSSSLSLRCVGGRTCLEPCRHTMIGNAQSFMGAQSWGRSEDRLTRNTTWAAFWRTSRSLHNYSVVEH